MEYHVCNPLLASVLAWNSYKSGNLGEGDEMGKRICDRLLTSSRLKKCRQQAKGEKHKADKDKWKSWGHVISMRPNYGHANSKRRKWPHVYVRLNGLCSLLRFGS